MNIFVTRPSIPLLEEYIEEIKPIFDSNILTNMGPVYKKLQYQLKGYLEAPELSLFVNGHMALEMALQAMAFPAGSEVITTPYTFVSTTHAITRNNLVPVWCDIKATDYTIDPEKIEELITEKTVAILPVHVYGNICDVEAIQAVADRHDLKVIYDGAHAFGVKYKGTGIANFGDMTMFSFHATKVFNTIEGGAVAFHDNRYCERLHELKNFGIHGEDTVNDIGGNAKLDEFRAAMGICNLRRMDGNLAKRKIVFERYSERLGGIPGLKLPAKQEDVQHNYAYYPVCFNKMAFGKSRDDIYDILKQNGIFSRRYFFPATNDMDCYADLAGKQKSTPIAHDVSRNILCLPMYAELALEDVDRICDVIIGKK